MEWWGTVLVSLGCAIIGGFFTWIAAKSNQKHQDKVQQKERIEKAIRERPRLEIKEYFDFSANNDSSKQENVLSILALGIIGFEDKNNRTFFKYNKKEIDKNNLVYVEYLFENTGLTEIEEVGFVSNLQRYMAIMNMNEKDLYLKNGFLNYDVWSKKRYIKPKDTIRVRIYYIKNQIPSTIFGSPEFVIWSKDIYGFVWSQVLNAPNNEIEISKLRSSDDLRNAINIETAIECFKNPLLW